MKATVTSSDSSLHSTLMGKKCPFQLHSVKERRSSKVCFPLSEKSCLSLCIIRTQKKLVIHLNCHQIVERTKLPNENEEVVQILHRSIVKDEEFILNFLGSCNL